MRSMKKSKDTESRNQPVVASVSKLICATRGQSSTLNGKCMTHLAISAAHALMVLSYTDWCISLYPLSLHFLKVIFL